MNWALKRQLMYLGIVLGFFALIILFFILRHKARQVETCYDGEQNQDERGIDCGGVCDLVCREDARPISIAWQRALPVTDDVYNAVSYVQNTNVAAAAQSVPYTFLIYDRNNILIAERSGTTMIPPNQRIAILEPGIVVGTRMPALVDFRFDADPTWFRSEDRFAQQNIITSSIAWERENSTPTLRADLMNTADFDVRNITAVALVYDSNGNAFATSQTLIDTIVQGTRKRVTFTWPKPFVQQIVRTEIVTTLDPFNQPEF
ncbi:hypothetical protein H6776_01685 [Candidatus Nomurabacteria bacterium]|nr:hypothetical protein [Candidatus Nomurabacteria bacterium]